MEVDAKHQVNSNALKWLYEMEALQSPVLRQNLYENVFLAHKSIRDCKIFITPSRTAQKGILIWLKLGIWAKMFYKDEIYTLVEQVINSLLPSFRVRIVDKENILNLAEQRLSEMSGGKNDSHQKSNPINSIDSGSDTAKPVSDTPRATVKEPLPKAPDLLPDCKELSDDSENTCEKTKQLDLQIDKEISSSR